MKTLILLQHCRNRAQRDHLSETIWLLLTHDQVDSDQFPLTREFLAHLLGVRRASVGTVVGTLQKASLIRYHRGVITILDRPGLEAAACECYRIVEAEYDRVLGVWRQHPL